MSASSASGSPSSSRASSESLPEVPLAKNNKSTAAQKAKNKKPSAGRNEGIDADWAYKPPAGAVAIESAADLGEFDWDALNEDEDNEVWLIRIPEGLKPKHLESAQLKLPSSDADKTAKLGMIQRKHVAYDVWSVGKDVPEELPIGGEEVKGLSCLLPRKSKKGRLYAGSIARTLVVAAQEARPTPDAASTPIPNVYKNPPRETYPKELLTHSFVPYGAKRPETTVVPADVEMDVDVDAEPSQRKPKKSKSKPVEDVDMDAPPPPSSVKKETKKSKDVGEGDDAPEKKSKSKKRKTADGDESPKKSKKVKTTS
ncbi:hypothetical protein MKEN_01238000 [Mycena kentingensis (nom. inval.)]|nr:hypothetical protein MKEN_01238000 [Mycena kentingensis (nom. inval.)]